MFGLWGKKKPALVSEPNEIYMAREIADAALVERVKGSDVPTIVTSFFPASLTRIEKLLTAAGVSAPFLGHQNWPSPQVATTARWLLDANVMTRPYGFDTWLTRTGQSFSFLFIEHYPLPTTERLALDALEQVSATCAHRTCFFVGLDEPLMLSIGGQKIVGLLERLGMDRGEKISHPMVDKSLLKAQARLEKQVRYSTAASSDREWFERNLSAK
jgi:hypothetical protein